MYRLQLFKKPQWEELLYICEKRINLVYDLEFYVGVISNCGFVYNIWCQILILHWEFVLFPTVATIIVNIGS